MIRELTVEESQERLRSTLQLLISIPQLNNDDFDYYVFEVLEGDVRSALGEEALDRLILARMISEAAKREILSLRAVVLNLIESIYEKMALSGPQVRRDEKWVEFAQSSQRILSQHVH